MPKVTALRAEDPEAVGGYRLTGRIGEGGQGTVFLGLHPSGARVAVKLLHARLAADDEARARFLREVSAAQRVARFSTARVLDADVVGDRPYVVTEYVDGPSLQSSVATDGPRTGGALERLAVGTAAALAAIHQAGIVHRDFKPGNVLLGPDGPRVIDFGIARLTDGADPLTRTAHSVGTPSYMAPEQLRRGPVGPPADLFAWGVTMVYAAVGTPAFGSDAVPAVIGRILRAEPDLSGVPAPLRELVAQCLTKDPAARPHARQVLDRLVGSSGPAHPGPVPGPVAAPPPDPPDAAATLTAVPQPPGAPASGAPASGAPASGAPASGAPAPGGPPRARRLVPGWVGRRWANGTRRQRMVLVGGALATVLAVGAAAVFGVRLFADVPKKFATVAHGCDMVSAATLRKWVPDSSVRLADDDPVESEKTLFYDSTGCEWGSHGRPRTWGNLDISVSVGHDVSQRVADELGDGDAPDGADRAADAQRDKLASARQRAKNPDHGPHAVAEGTPVTVPGIGDEAFAYSIVGKDSEMADLMTVKLEARWGNAAITVEYNAMRYDAAHHGSATSESTARAGAEAAARDIVHYLADCTACLRGAGT